MSTPGGPGGQDPYRKEEGPTEYRLEDWDVPGSYNAPGEPDAQQTNYGSPGYGPPDGGYGPPASAPPGSGPPDYGGFGPPPPPPKKSKTGLIIGLIAGGVALLLCGGAVIVGIVLFNRGDGTTTTTGSPDPTSTAGSGSTSGTGGGGAGKHTLPTAPCTSFDATPFRTAFGYKVDQGEPDSSKYNYISSTASCKYEYEAGDYSTNNHVSTSIDIEASIAPSKSTDGSTPDQSAKKDYDKDKGSTTISGVPAAVAGVGSEAYIISETKASGVDIEFGVLDGNSILTIKVHAYGDGSAALITSKVQPTLVSIAQASLTKY